MHLPVRRVPFCSAVALITSSTGFEVVEALISGRVGLKAGPVVPPGRRTAVFLLGYVLSTTTQC